MLIIFKKFILSLSSFFPGLILYLFTFNFFPEFENTFFTIVKILVLIIILISLSVISIFIIGKNEYDNIQINSIQPVENELIPTYLGLFVIMLGLGSLSLVYQLAIVFMLFIIWWLLMERSYYFNLIWLFRYRYYRVSDDKGNTYIIYSKRKDCKSPIQFNNLRRINNFTFFEGEDTK